MRYVERMLDDRRIEIYDKFRQENFCCEDVGLICEVAVPVFESIIVILFQARNYKLGGKRRNDRIRTR